MMDRPHSMATCGQTDRVDLVEARPFEKGESLLKIGLWRRYTHCRVRLQRIDSPRSIGHSLLTTQSHRHDGSQRNKIGHWSQISIPQALVPRP